MQISTLLLASCFSGTATIGDMPSLTVRLSDGTTQTYSSPLLMCVIGTDDPFANVETRMPIAVFRDRSVVYLDQSNAFGERHNRYYICRLEEESFQLLKKSILGFVEAKPKSILFLHSTYSKFLIAQSASEKIAVYRIGEIDFANHSELNTFERKLATSFRTAMKGEFENMERTECRILDDFWPAVFSYKMNASASR